MPCACQHGSFVKQYAFPSRLLLWPSPWQHLCLRKPSTVGDPWPHCLGAIEPIGRVTIPGTGGRPSQELAGDHSKNWRPTIPRTGGRPSQELAGDHPVSMGFSERAR